MVWIEDLEGRDKREFNLDFTRFDKSFISIKLFEKIAMWEGSQVANNDSEIDINMTHNQGVIKVIKPTPISSISRIKSADKKLVQDGDDSVFDYGGVTNNNTITPSVM